LQPAPCPVCAHPCSKRAANCPACGHPLVYRTDPDTNALANLASFFIPLVGLLLFIRLVVSAREQDRIQGAYRLIMATLGQIAWAILIFLVLGAG
jgi:hypothetical protein